MALMLAWMTTVATLAVIGLTMKKVWWAPIAGLSHEVLWIAYACYSVDGWPIAIAALGYSLVYGFSIRKWWRER